MSTETTVVLTKLELDASQAIKETKTLNDAQAQTNKTMDEASESTTDYSGALDGMISKMGVLPGAAGGAVKGIMGMTRGMNGLKVAIIATGIGALIVALGALFTWFNRSAEGQEKLKQGMAILGQITNVLMDAFAWLGETIFKAFENPKKSIKDLWEFIKNNLINRVTALKDIFSSLGQVIASAFKADLAGLKEGLKDLGTALVQVSTGFDAEQQIAMVNKLKGAWDEAAASIDKANQIQKERNQLSRDEIAFLTEAANLNVKIAEAKLKATDKDAENADRLAAASQAIADTNKLFDEQIRLKEKQVDLLRREQDLSNNTIEDNRALAELEAELINLNAQRASGLKLVRNLQNSITDAIVKEREEYAASITDIGLKRKDLQVKETTDLNTQLSAQMAARKVANDATIKMYKETAATQAEIDQQSADFRVEQNQTAADSTVALLNFIGQKNKVAARFGVVLGTAQAIVASMKVGMPWALPGIALATLTGLKQLQIINTAKAARGGLLSGPSHKQGGVLIEAEGGEAIINKRSMANPYLRRLASDINRVGGGVAFAQNGMLVGQSQLNSSINALNRELQSSIKETKAVLVVEDFNRVNNRINVRESISTLG